MHGRFVDGLQGWSDATCDRFTAPTRVLIGDRNLVRVEHAAHMHEVLPDARLAVVPGATHVGLLHETDVVVPILTASSTDRERTSNGWVSDPPKFFNSIQSYRGRRAKLHNTAEAAIRSAAYRRGHTIGEARSHLLVRRSRLRRHRSGLNFPIEALPDA